MKRLITTQRVGDLHTIEVYRSPYSGYEVIITGDRTGLKSITLSRWKTCKT